MKEHKLTIELTKMAEAIEIKITGCSDVDWAKYIKKAQDTIIEQLQRQYNPEKDLEQSKERLLESIAEMSGKSVDKIKKELSKMKGSEKENITKLALETALNYMEKDIKDE